MNERDKERIKAQVPCSALLENAGWKVDPRESTPKAVKYRRGEGEILIVIHHGRGWFDPMSPAKGDVFSLAQHLGAADFSSALRAVADLIGFEPAAPSWQRKSRPRSAPPVAKRWSERPGITRGSAAWTYLTQVRALPPSIIEAAAAMGTLREGPKASVWAAHVDCAGNVVGWEERGPNWRGFASGGAKELFVLGNEHDAGRICVTEAAIDAISLAALEGRRRDSLYVSTGGGWAPATDARIRALASRPNAQLVAASDANDQGDVYATRLRTIAASAGAAFLRLWPDALDWNEQLNQARG
jgi:hypothetical protein